MSEMTLMGVRVKQELYESICCISERGVFHCVASNSGSFEM